MLGDFRLTMPSDLRSKDAVFELDSPPATQRAKGIARLTVEIPSSYNAKLKAEPHPPPRWRTAEFMCYYVVFAFALPLMAWIPYQLSSRESSLHAPGMLMRTTWSSITS